MNTFYYSLGNNNRVGPVAGSVRLEGRYGEENSVDFSYIISFVYVLIEYFEEGWTLTLRLAEKSHNP